jgi:hypothetical protein
LNMRFGGPGTGLDVVQKRKKKSVTHTGILNLDGPIRSLLSILYILPHQWYVSAGLLRLTPHREKYRSEIFT